MDIIAHQQQQQPLDVHSPTASFCCRIISASLHRVTDADRRLNNDEQIYTTIWTACIYLSSVQLSGIITKLLWAVCVDQCTRTLTIFYDVIFAAGGNCTTVYLWEAERSARPYVTYIYTHKCIESSAWTEPTLNSIIHCAVCYIVVSCRRRGGRPRDPDLSFTSSERRDDLSVAVRSESCPWVMMSRSVISIRLCGLTLRAGYDDWRVSVQRIRHWHRLDCTRS